MSKRLGPKKGLGELNTFTNQSDKIATDLHIFLGHPVDGVSIVDGPLPTLKRNGKLIELTGEIPPGGSISLRFDHRDLGKDGRDLIAFFTRRGFSLGPILDFR